MLYKTRGIVFRITKYGDTSIIVNIFTHLFGLQSYIVNGVRSKSSRNAISLYQPLTLLDMVVYHRESANILRIKEARCLHAYQSIHTDIRKTTIALFLSELLNKSVKDQSNAELIYDFLMRSFITLDQLDAVENFHLIFLIKLSRHLGFGPQATHEILEGQRVTEVEDRALQELLVKDFGNCPAISYEVRTRLLECLLAFYGRHIESLGEIRSVNVLREILGN